MSANAGSDRFLGLFILCKQILNLCDDIGRTLDKIRDLINGVGLALLSDVDEFDVTALVDDKEAYGNNGKTCSTAATEVLAR